MSIAIYEAAGAVAAIALPARGEQVEAAPAVFETVHVPAVTEERSTPGRFEKQEDGTYKVIEPPHVETVDVVPAHDEQRIVSEAVYRDETPAEIVARMAAAGLLPDLPWSRFKIVAAMPAGKYGVHWSIDWATGIVTALGHQAAALKAYAAEKRWSVETGGMTSTTYGPLLTDRDTQAAIDRTLAAIDKGLVIPPIDFKGAMGWVQIDRTTLLAIGATIAGHVQAAFSVEKAIDAAIAAGVVTTFAHVDNPSTVGLPSWPGSNPAPVPSIASVETASGTDALAQQVRYEIAMQAHNNSAYALEKLAAEAAARGITAAQLADQIIAERQALEASVMQAYASNIGGTS